MHDRFYLVFAHIMTWVMKYLAFPICFYSIPIHKKIKFVLSTTIKNGNHNFYLDAWISFLITVSFIFDWSYQVKVTLKIFMFLVTVQPSASCYGHQAMQISPNRTRFGMRWAWCFSTAMCFYVACISHNLQRNAKS